MLIDIWEDYIKLYSLQKALAQGLARRSIRYQLLALVNALLGAGTQGMLTGQMTDPHPLSGAAGKSPEIYSTAISDPLMFRTIQ